MFLRVYVCMCVCMYVQQFINLSPLSKNHLTKHSSSSYYFMTNHLIINSIINVCVREREVGREKFIQVKFDIIKQTDK